MSDDWIVPFGGRKETGPYGQNLLWRCGHVYVMDNHRAAAWCWQNEINSSLDHALIHIDRHYDTLGSQMQEWLHALPQGLPRSIDDYLSIRYHASIGAEPLVIRWDNYLSIYLALHGAALTQAFFATHHEGDRPRHQPIVEISPQDLPTQLKVMATSLKAPAILNLDLDYFFECDGEDAVRMFDDAYFEKVIDAVVDLDRSGKIGVVTIALTATRELTGGWHPPEQLAQRACAALGCDFKLS